MTERLSKAERDVCRKRWEHPCDLEPERHACTIIDLLNDLDALEQELGQARKTRRCVTHGDVDGAHQWGCPECVRELRQELEQAAAREALLCEELKKCNHNYLQMGCLKKKELCAPCSLIDNTSEAARALLEIKWKWDWFNSDAISGGDLSRIAAIADERDTLRAAAIKATGSPHLLCVHPAKVKGCDCLGVMFAKALCDVGRSDEEA